MNILLINPIARQWALPNCFPSGLGYISSVLKQANHKVDILDLNALRNDDALTSFSSDKGYDLIGLTGIITQYGEVKRLAEKCKQLYPQTPIVCGGSLATSIPYLLLSKTEIDSCILGEGEEVIFDILDDLFNTGNASAFYHSNSVLIKNISSIPWPDYDAFPIEIYINNPLAADNLNKWKDGKWVTNTRRSLNMIGSRGCTANCLYCYHCYMGQGWRIRSTADILGEMGMLKEKYGIEYIHFVDDAFACSKKKIIEFCKGKLLSNATDIKWSCAGRANIMDEEMIALMAKAGCIGICFGLESGSQKMLDIMNKRISIEQYERAIALNKKYFTYEDYTIMTNMLGETPEDVQLTINFCKRNKIKPSAVFLTQAYPGTELFNILIRQGRVFPGDMNWMENYVLSLGEQGEKLNINFTDYSDEDVIKWQKRIIEETDAGNKN